MKLKSWLIFGAIGALWGIFGVNYPGSWLFLPTRIAELAFKNNLLYLFSAIIGALIVLLIIFVKNDLEKIGRKRK